MCSPRPLIDTMPFVYRSDPLAEQLCAAFDDVLAPIFATLDCLPAYLDPRTSPEDMLDWLARWIGLTVGAHTEPVRKRELITAGAALLPWRGTARSVREAVVAAFNRETEVIESGSATWSITPNSKPGGQPVPALIVRVFTEKDDDIDPRSLDALVESVKPAHIPHRVEVVIRPPQPPADGEGPSDGGANEASTVGGADEASSVSGGDGETAPIVSGSAAEETSIIPVVGSDDGEASTVDGGDGDKPSDS